MSSIFIRFQFHIIVLLAEHSGFIERNLMFLISNHEYRREVFNSTNRPQSYHSRLTYKNQCIFRFQKSHYTAFLF